MNNITSSEIHKETNERIYMRNIPSQQLQPYFDIRPLNSKYTLLPIVEPRQLQFSVPLQKYPTYNIHQTFNPGNRNAPFSGYANNINTESELKGQIFALQKASQAVYVPKSNSDLYNYSFVAKTDLGKNINGNAHSLLFHREKFTDFNPNPYSNIVGAQLWGNATRVQLHDIPENYCSGGSGGGTSNMR